MITNKLKAIYYDKYNSETKLNKFLRTNKSLTIFLMFILLMSIGFAYNYVYSNGDQEGSGELTYTNITADRINEVLYVEAGNYSDLTTKLNMCGSQGCKVHIPKGVYSVTTGTNLSAIPSYSSLVIEGDGKETILNVTSDIGAFSAVFYGTDVGNIEIKNLKIQGNNISDSGIRLLGTSENVKIINVDSSNHQAYGISIAGVTNLLISGTRTNNNTDRSDGEGRGIYLTSNDNVVIENCEASYNKRYGIMSHSNTRIRVSGCVADYNTGDRGIFFYRGSEIIISNNIAIYNNFAGITVESADAIVEGNIAAYSTGLDGFLARNENASIYSGNLVISNNQFFGNARHGINIDQNINHTVISNNFIKDNVVDGIVLSNHVNDGFITGNYFAGNNGSGIHPSTDVDNFIISGNYLQGTATSGVQAIRIGSSDCDNIAVRDNYYSNWLSNIFNGGTGTTFGVSADTISEQTSGTGVTIDGVLLKDGGVDWSNLTGYPVACPAGTYITQLNDSVTCTSEPTETSKQGLILSMNFNNQSISGNTIFDSSGSNLKGTNIGGVHVANGGYDSSGAYDFDNGFIYLDPTGTGALSIFTIELRMKVFDETGAASNIVSFLGSDDSSANGYFGYKTDQDDWLFEFDDGTQVLTTGNDAVNSLGEFITLVIDYNGTDFNMYEDNVLLVSSSQSGKTFKINVIGGNGYSATSINGTISNLRVWNRVLSDEERTGNYLEKIESINSYVSQKDIQIDSSGNANITTGNLTIGGTFVTIDNTIGITGNYTINDICWIYYTGGIVTSTNCTAI